MTVRRHTTAGADRVWEVLNDGWSFAAWVVGSARIRSVDPQWPSVGACFDHSVGLWPFLLDDHTCVLACEPRRGLTLQARAAPFGAAMVTLRLHDDVDGGGCVIEMSEVAASRPLRWLPNAVQEAIAWPRNRECTRRLALLAERAAGSSAKSTS